MCCDFLKLLCQRAAPQRYRKSKVLSTLSASSRVPESADDVGSDTKRSQGSVTVLVNDIWGYRISFQFCSAGFQDVLPKEQIK